MVKARRKKSGKPKWPSDLLARVRSLRDRFGEKKLDAFLISSQEDIRYLTGFPAEDACALVTGRGVVIISDRRFEEDLSGTYAYAASVMRKKNLTDELKKLGERYKIKRLGVQAEHVTLAARKAIAKGFGAKSIVETSGWLLDQRSVKDDGEVKLLRKAVAIQEKALTQLLTELKPGMTEKQISARLEYLFLEFGGDGTAFKTIVGAGANSSVPHYFPADVKLKKNSPLLIDSGVWYRGYRSDMTRVYCVGKFPKKIAEIYNIVEAAFKAGVAAVTPGAALADVDKAARQVIVDAGYGKAFGHSLGHGIGLVIHEEPRLSHVAKGELKVGQVVTIEPGIYLPGVGGVRLEDDVLVTKSGRRNLCSLPTDIESAMI
ncbi:MAG: M24 family metallopeptidase [Phycisphaera sp.]|nr:M24 family metallopeptidase [Phycisphaera sp.]